MKHKRTPKLLLPPGKGEKAATSREGCKEARSPGESQVSYSKKVKFRVSVKDTRDFFGDRQ